MKQLGDTKTERSKLIVHALDSLKCRFIGYGRLVS